MSQISRLTVALIAFVLAVLWAPLALAADSTALAELSSAALDILMPAILVVLAWLARKVVKIFEAKTNIDIPQKQENQIDHWVAQGARYAEKKARTAAKEGFGEIKGPEKLELAVQYALDLAYEQGLTNWSRERLEAKIEAYLAERDELRASP